MVELHAMCREHRCLPILASVVIGMLLIASSGTVAGQQKKMDVLKIGTSGSMSNEMDEKKEAAALETLRDFIKEETGLDNVIVNEPNWNVLAEKLSKGDPQIGVFEGIEFAWAKQKYPGLKPLALSVNVHRYPTVHIVARKDKGPKDIAALKGKTIAIPATNQRFLTMFLNFLTEKTAKLPADQFLGKINRPENTDEALDDAVDGIVQAAVVDRAALESFKRRKPGRFNQLQELAQSEPMPPVILAYYEKMLPDKTLTTFHKGILNANQKEKGQTILTLFRLTGFESVPNDFAKVLEQTRKTYPPPAIGKEATK